MNRSLVILYIFLSLLACHSPGDRSEKLSLSVPFTSPARQIGFDSAYKVIHVFVALCDNKYQGIVPVPAAIGIGQDPNSNLYWGCDAGIRTWFKKSPEWELWKRYRVDSIRLERVVFKHRTKDYFLVADAYDGKFIRQCTIDFLRSCSGQSKDTLHIKDHTIGIDGNAQLIAYIGHDGLMDFRIDEQFPHADSLKRDAIVLACISKKYFAPLLSPTGATPLVLTTGLMCPEAYTLHDALSAYIRGESRETIRNRAAKAYALNQHCSERAARNLLVTGWE
jgi:hypothetical protein